MAMSFALSIFMFFYFDDVISKWSAIFNHYIFLLLAAVPCAVVFSNC